MSNALKNYANSERKAKGATPQGQRTPGRTDEVKNNAGGYVFKVSDLDRLRRFLILGTEGNTYYVGAREQTEQSIDFLKKMIAADEAAVLREVVDVSSNGRAYKNTPAIFAMAALLTFGENKAENKAAVNKVVRTGTHLFEFTNYLKALGGMGRAKRSALAGYYTSKTAEQVAYQSVKYRSREGMTHRDVFRIAHPKGVTPSVGDFILKGEVSENAPEILQGFKAMQSAGTEKEVLSILNEYKNLPWETIPTQFLKSEKVWKTLFYNNQLNGQALVRNITRLAKMDAFNDMVFARDYAKRLTDEEMIARTKLHPINFLNASVVYSEGQSQRGGWSVVRTKNWKSSGIISDALDEGFHKSFKFVEPANARTLVGLDVSGSMSSPAMGLDLSCAQVGAAMAMTIARTEPYAEIRGFTFGGGYGYGRKAALTDLGITGRTSLPSAMQKTSSHTFGATDCAQPMLWALENRVEVDHFVVITDNETWHGDVKPHQALKQYRDKTGIDARVSVVGASGTEFTIADSSGNMMDFVGADANLPKLLADFGGHRL